MDHLDPELISAYIDGELSPADMQQVERHLAACEACRTEFEELRGMSTLVRELPLYLPRREIVLEQAPESMSPTLARIIEFSKPLAIAAVILLVAFAGLRLLTDLGDDASEEGDQISFSQVQPTQADGTERAAAASDTTAAEAPAAAAPTSLAELNSAAADEEAPFGSETPGAPVPAMMQQATVEPTLAPTPTPAPAIEEDTDDMDPLVTAAIVVVVVIMVGGAAAWYMLFRSPRGNGG